jgi:hypothetical protein
LVVTVTSGILNSSDSSDIHLGRIYSTKNRRSEMFGFRISKQVIIVTFVFMSVFFLAACGGQSAAPVVLPPHTPSATVSFSKDVLPILQDKCVNCHGGEKTSKGLDLKTFTSLMAGSQNGAMIVPGDPSNSKLIQSVVSGKMPKRGSPLPADQIQLIMDWVTSGAVNN